MASFCKMINVIIDWISEYIFILRYVYFTLCIFSVVLFTGIWYSILQTISFLSIVTNVSIIVVPGVEYQTHPGGTNMTLIITSLLSQNEVTTLFWRNDDVDVTSCVRWDISCIEYTGWKHEKLDKEMNFLI